MKNIFSVLLLALSTTAIAQPGKAPEAPAPPPLSFEEMRLPPVRESEEYKNISEQVMNAINSEPNNIMEAMSNEMHLQYPGDKMVNYVKGIKKEYGDARNFRFLTITGSVARYEASFDKKHQVLMKLGLDKEGRLSLLSFSPYNEEKEVPPLEQNSTKLSLPFNGEWYVLSGGINNINQENFSFSQRAAVTFVMRKGDNTYKTNGYDNTDYYAYGQAILAPCDATVVRVIDNINDNEPGSINTMFAGGNTVVLKTDKNEYIVLGHLKDGSIKVKEGDKVKKGATLAECGNSGDSKEPSLYFNVQNTDGTIPTIGAKALFSNVVAVMPNGKTENKQLYTPVMGSSVKAN